MSGIATSGAGDVKLDGDPNAFTGTNTYDVNRPTSTLTSTPAATDFITKQDGENLFTSSTGDALLAGSNAFTGTNSFNTNRPTSTLTSTISATDFLTKQNADTLYTGSAGDVQEGGNNVFTGTNTFNTNRPTSTLTSTPASTDFLTKQNADTLYGGGSGDAVLAAGTAANPQQFTGVCDFKGGSLQMSNPNQTLSMIQVDTATSDVNTLAMTGRRNRITQTGLSNAILNEFTQSGGANTASAISQFTANSLIYQATTTARFVSNGRIGVGVGFSPSCELDVAGETKLQNGGAYIYVYSGDIRISGSSTSYTSWGNGGHHIDTYTASNGAGRRMYINYYANQGVTLTRTNITSDDRIKEDEKFIENATDTLLKLRPQTYIKYAPVIDGSTIKPNFDLSGNFESGLIAQEIYYDAPELKHIVSITDMSNDDIIPSSDDPTKDPDYSDWGDMPASVDYIQLIPYLIKSNQELHERITILEAKINNM